MKTHIQKQKNDLALRLPKAFAEYLGLKQGSPVEITVRNGGILVTPLTKKFTLSELLKGVIPENIHSEIYTDPATGKEIW